jgi:hypothetical protein
MVTKHEMGHVAQIRNLTVLLPEPQDLGPRPKRLDRTPPPVGEAGIPDEIAAAPADGGEDPGSGDSPEASAP